MLSIAMKIRARLASRDHEAVRDLFQALKTEIEVHSKIEDLHVYRIFQQAEATRDAAARALEAHRAIQASLDALGGGPSESDWPMRFEKVYKSLEQHARDEEQHLFGRAGEILTREEAHELDLTIETARRQITGQEPPPAGGIPAG
jgi:hemerythrin superfamily protein